MTSAELLIDGFARVRESVADVLEGLTPRQLAYRLDADANPISWLIWHLTRVQDDHVAKAFDIPQVWSADGWAVRFGLPANTTQIGYGQLSGQVAAFAAATADASLLAEYHEATYEQTVKLVSAVTDTDLARVVDTRWTPPVTLAVRLVSVINDDTQHVGQAAYVKGIILRQS